MKTGDRLSDGRFTLEGFAGGGGTGTVYRACEVIGPGMTRVVAIKVLRSTRGSPDALLKSIRPEAEALLELSSSPHIVAMHAYGVAPEGEAWLAMEFLERSAESLIQEHPADPGLVRALVTHIGEALRVLHGRKHPILHRDIKPANVLFGEAAPVLFKLADFGLAGSRRDDATIRTGTVRYSAPEMFEGDQQEDATSDLYSLGMMAYELSLGRALFAQQFPWMTHSEGHGSSGEVTRWVGWHASAHLRATPVATLVPGFPERLSATIARLMEKERDKRYKSVDDMFADLEQSSELAPRPAGSPGAVALPSLAPGRRATQIHERKTMNWWNRQPRVLKLALPIAGVIGLAVFALTLFSKPMPVVEVSSAIIRSTGEPLVVKGTIRNMRPELRAELRLRPREGEKTRAYPVAVEADGSFGVPVTLPEPGSRDARVAVSDGAAELASSVVLTLQRDPPAEVAITMQVRPSYPGIKLFFSPADGRPFVTGETDAGGKASVRLPPGKFTVSCAPGAAFAVEQQNANFETGWDAAKACEVRVAAKYVDVNFEVAPAEAVIELRKISDAGAEDVAAVTVPLDERGRASKRVETARYRVTVKADGYSPYSEDVQFALGERQEFRASLGQPSDPTKVAGGRPKSRAEANKQIVNSMKPSDVERFVRERAPLPTLSYSWNDQLKLITMRGQVVNQHELDTLKTRLKPAEWRLDMTEVRVDPAGVRAALSRRLTEGGAADVAVRVLNERDPNASLLVQARATKELDEDLIRGLVLSYVFDPASVAGIEVSKPDR
jgi:serine/threonine protein kinase